MMRTITKGMIKKQRYMFLCFIDYKKAFDKIRHEELVKMLEGLDTDGKELR